MADDIFVSEDDEMEFVSRPEDATFSRRDVDGIIRKLNALLAQPPGTEGKVRVFTGEIKRGAKQNNGRGKNELAEAKLYQKVANEMGYGLKIAPTHLTNGYTVLRMRITTKRVFSDEQVANRLAGQNKRRLFLAQQRQGKAAAALRVNPEDAEAKKMLAEATAAVKDLEVKVNGKPTARTAKQTQPAS